MDAAPESPQTSDCQETATCDSAAHSPGAHLRLWGVALLGVAADLWTKHWAYTNLRGQPPRQLADGLLSFHYNTNAGALFGMGKSIAPLFILASVFALIFVVYIFLRSRRSQYSFHIALGMVLAGAMGNLFDRLFVGGKVRDFIKIELQFGEHEVWPWVFNVADMLLVCGVSILLLNIWFDRRFARKPECEQSVTPA